MSFYNFIRQHTEYKVLGLQEISIVDWLKSKETSKAFPTDLLNQDLIEKVELLQKLELKPFIEQAISSDFRGYYDPNNFEFNRQPYDCFKALCQENKSELIKVFRQHTPNSVLKLIGYQWREKQRMRIKDSNGKTKQLKVSPGLESITEPTRRAVTHQRWLEALQTRQQQIEKSLLDYHIINICLEGKFESAFTHYGAETVLNALFQSSDDLAIWGKALNYYTQRHFKPPTIHIASEQLEQQLSDTLTQMQATFAVWLQRKTPIAYDLETYESLIHKQLCQRTKTGKWCYYNIHTNQRQFIEPGLDVHANTIRLLSISDGKQSFVIDLGVSDGASIPLWLKEIEPLLTQLFTKNQVINHNIYFDMASMRKYGWVLNNPSDSMLGLKLLMGDCGAGRVFPGGYSLANACKNLLGQEVNKGEQKSNWGANLLSHDQLHYSGLDPALAIALHRRIEYLFTSDESLGLQTLSDRANYKLWKEQENRVLVPAIEMAHNGIPVDANTLKEQLSTLKQSILALQAKLQVALPDVTNVNSSLQLKRGLKLKYPDIEITKTNKAFISDNKHQIPELDLLGKIRSNNAALQQLAKIDTAVSIYGHLKTQNSTMTGTGRFNSGNNKSLGCPNLQAFIKKSELDDGSKLVSRAAFRYTDPKMCFIAEDLQAAHGRISTSFGKDQRGLALYGVGGTPVDGHSIFAMLAIQFAMKDNPEAFKTGELKQLANFMATVDDPYNTDAANRFKALAEQGGIFEALRDGAKNIYYSALNYAQAEKIRQVCNAKLQIELNINVGQELYNAYWNIYSGVRDFILKQLANTEKSVVTGQTFYTTRLPDGTKLTYAAKRGQVDPTKIVACQWSRTESTIMKQNLIGLHELAQTHPEYDIQLMNLVHDEIDFGCQVKYRREVYQTTLKIYETNFGEAVDWFIPYDKKDSASKLKAFMKKTVPMGWNDMK